MGSGAGLQAEGSRPERGRAVVTRVPLNCSEGEPKTTVADGPDSAPPKVLDLVSGKHLVTKEWDASLSEAVWEESEPVLF